MVPPNGLEEFPPTGLKLIFVQSGMPLDYQQLVLAGGLVARRFYCLKTGPKELC
jgi:hypothetical protein